MLIDISVALLSTKLPILLGRAVGPFSLPKLPLLRDQGAGCAFTNVASPDVLSMIVA
jgi:hypothetical protein